ncbi:hypothetical protein [Hymenobacter lapidiphilus]|nr:hypothetical protein [Hymenobacter lapidiphilus]
MSHYAFRRKAVGLAFTKNTPLAPHLYQKQLVACLEQPLPTAF